MTNSHRLVATVLFVASALGVFAATPLTSLVDDQAPVVVSIHDVPTLVKNWKQSPWMKTWNDEQMKKFLAPLRAQMEIDEWDERCKRETGYTANELLGFATGDALVALANLDFVFDAPQTQAPVLFAIELGDNAAKVEKLLMDAAEKDKESPETIEEFSGVAVHIKQVQSEEDDEPAQTVVWAFADGVGLLSPSKEKIFAAIDALKGGGVPNAFGQSERFLRLKQSSGDSHVTMLANMQVIYPALQRMAEARSGDGGGLDISGLLRALGLDAIEEISGSLSVGETATRMSGSLTYSERRGLLKMLAYRDGPAPQPKFVSAKWITVASVKFSIRDAYAALEEILASFNPMIHGLVQGQINGLNQQLGIDLKRDLIGSLGEDVVTAYAARPGTTTPDQLNDLDQFFAVSLENPVAFTSAMEALKRMMGPQAEQFIEKRTYLDQTIYTFNPPQVEGAPRGKTFSYAIARNYFLLGIGSAAPVEAALQNFDSTQPSFWDLPEVKTALAEAPPNASGIQYQNLRLLVGSMIETIVATAPLMTQPDPSEEADQTEPQPAPFDLSAKPDAATLAKYWSYATGYSWQDSRGFYFKSTVIHPQ